jgi:hypothetical protein
MSNIFIRDIDGVGGSVFDVPDDDTELAAATTAIDNIVTTVPSLTYATLLAWVETADGASPSRTLNALVQTFEYNSKECPNASEVNTMTSGIKSLLEADGNINTIGAQQVSIYQAGGGGGPFTRDAGGFIYPTVATDELYIGGAVPNGVWFDTGHLVLGASTMSGSGERLRVIGDVRVESNVILPGLTSGVFVGTSSGSGVFSEQIRAYSDTQAGISAGVLSDLVDTDPLGNVFAGFKARFVSAAASSGRFVGFEVDPSGGDFGWSQIGFRMPDMVGTALQGSEGFVQEGPNETNRFSGRCAIGGSVGSSSSLKVSTSSLGSGATWVNVDVDRGPFTLTGGFNWNLVQVSCNLPNAVGQSAGRVDYVAVKTPVSAQAVTVTDCAGIDIEPIGIAANYTFTNPTYGIHQQGAGDLNWFAGKVGIGAGKSVPTEDLEVAANIRCDGVYKAGALSGVSGSFTTTDGKTVTVTNGIITNIV